MEQVGPRRSLLEALFSGAHMSHAGNETWVRLRESRSLELSRSLDPEENLTDKGFISKRLGRRISRPLGRRSDIIVRMRASDAETPHQLIHTFEMNELLFQQRSDEMDTDVPDLWDEPIRSEFCNQSFLQIVANTSSNDFEDCEKGTAVFSIE